jgi:hypothetical protein
VEMVLLVDDINVLVIYKEKDVTHQKMMIMKQLETWFQVNNLLINIKKIQLPCHSILYFIIIWKLLIHQN